jgi:ATP-dependent helicase/nuclease subunit A
MVANLWVVAMLTDDPKPLNQLTPAQQAAVEPDRNVWLSASAGTGKTQVLSARVIRLLLEDGVWPQNLLCLTFTKAAAAEMAERINRRLASWVQMPDNQLKAELFAIGVDGPAQHLPRARKLFARVLDAPGGGLQIMTIHAFCQSLLGSFPEEAGLLPGFEPVEGRAEYELLDEALESLIAIATASGQEWIIGNIQQLSLDLGEEGAVSFLHRCAKQPLAMDLVPEDQGALVFARRLVDIELEGPTDVALAERLSDSQINVELVRTMYRLNRDWNTKTGDKRVADIAAWMAMTPEDRLTHFGLLHHSWATQKNELAAQPKTDAYQRVASEAFIWSRSEQEFQAQARYADRLAAALLVGKAFAARYAELKHQRGLVDFNDMIVRAADLLGRPGMGEWVRYKLDQRIDHVLVDEAQDTNKAQWDIIEALTDDFYSGFGAGSERARTIFAVGDFKQAIYGFQGTDPKKYDDAGRRFATKMKAADQVLHRLSLSQSFRSSMPVLQFVDAVADHVGYENFGLSKPIEKHISQLGDAGSVTLLPPISGDSDYDDGGEEDWLGEDKRILAATIADYVKRLVDTKQVLASTGKPLVPGDIMILLRKRTDLASLIVARLHANDVAVAGIDRLRINEPIAVQDLLSAIRFVLQPDDDLSLACVLVSPLIGWSQDDLLKYGYRPEHMPLWQHIRGQVDVVADVELLSAMLNMADLTTPFAFLETLLSGPMRGRQKFLARLGNETLVPIEELLNLTLQYQQQGGTSLQGFLNWFEKGGEEIKREGLAQSSDVRVMTVHGAKGLEAPVVILADAAIDPLSSAATRKPFDLELGDDDARLPLLFIDKLARVGRLEDARAAHQASELREHYRLLYVAMTRASEHLVIAGSLGKKGKDPPQHSWYQASAEALAELGGAFDDQSTMRFVGNGVAVASKAAAIHSETRWTGPLPDWLTTAAPAESIPPKPLAPSNLDDDRYGDAPASDAMRLAAKRGKLLHSLFEQYDGRAVQRFEADALAWLSRNDMDQLDHAEMVAQAVAALQNPEWAALFSPKARAEVPLAAVVGSTVISGRVDRLLVDVDRIRFVDFKTGRHVPDSPDQVAGPIIRQMAHYAAALEAIFPGRQVEASLLYTSGPKLIQLTADRLAPHKPA